MSLLEMKNISPSVTVGASEGLRPVMISCIVLKVGVGNKANSLRAG